MLFWHAHNRCLCSSVLLSAPIKCGKKGFFCCSETSTKPQKAATWKPLFHQWKESRLILENTWNASSPYCSVSQSWCSFGFVLFTSSLVIPSFFNILFTCIFTVSFWNRFLNRSLTKTSIVFWNKKYNYSKFCHPKRHSVPVLVVKNVFLVQFEVRTLFQTKGFFLKRKYATYETHSS